MQRVSIEVTSSALPEPAPALPRRQRAPRRASRFLILVSVILLGNALVGERGFVALIRATRQVNTVAGLIDALRAENNQLRENVRSLLEDPRTIEDVARGELGLIEPGEKLFIIGDPRAASSDTQLGLAAPGESGVIRERLPGTTTDQTRAEQ